MDSLLFTSEGATWLGAWVGLGVALLVFSAILGDHWAARLGQYILVGAGLGYAAAASWQALRTLPMIEELRQDPIGHWWHWIGVALAVLLALAALERIFAQGAGGPPPPGWRRWLLRLGAVPTTLLLALGVAVAVLGVIQGTLAPQLLFAAQTGLQLDASLDVFLTGALTLVLTVCSIFFFAVDPERHLADQPAFVRRVVMHDLDRPAWGLACGRGDLCAPGCLARQPAHRPNGLFPHCAG